MKRVFSWSPEIHLIEFLCPSEEPPPPRSVHWMCLNTRPSSNSLTTDSSSAYAHITTITVTIKKCLLSYLGETFIADDDDDDDDDDDEHALCYVACHSKLCVSIWLLWQPGVVQCVTTVCWFQCSCYFLLIVMSWCANPRAKKFASCIPQCQGDSALFVTCTLAKFNVFVFLHICFGIFFVQPCVKATCT